MQQASDQQLVEAAQSGDKAALETLLNRHYPRISGLCLRMAHNKADAQDATQDAMIAIVNGLKTFDGRSSFSTWSYRVATNATLDELRRKKRRLIPDNTLSQNQPNNTTSPGRYRDETKTDNVAHATGQSDPHGDFQHQLAERDQVLQALQQLDEPFRTAVVLRDYSGFDYQQIAETLNIAIGTVRSRIARGRSKLAETLIAQDPSLGGGGRGSQAKMAEFGNLFGVLFRHKYIGDHTIS